VFAGAPSEAQATFSLRLQSGVADVTIFDNGAGDTDPLGGSITLANTTTVGSFTLKGTIGTTSNSLFGAFPTVTIGTLSVTAASTGTLKITVTDDAFTTQTPGAAIVDNAITSTSAQGKGTVTYSSVVAGQGSPVLSIAAGGANSTSGTYSVNLPSQPAGFAVTSITTLNVTKAGQFQLQGNTIVETPQGGPLPTPAPAGLVLAFTGAPFLIVGRLRRYLRA